MPRTPEGIAYATATVTHSCGHRRAIKYVSGSASYWRASLRRRPCGECDRTVHLVPPGATETSCGRYGWTVARVTAAAGEASCGDCREIVRLRAALALSERMQARHAERCGAGPEACRTCRAFPADQGRFARALTRLSGREAA